MISVTAEDRVVMAEVRKMERETFKRQVIEMRASGMNVAAIAHRFGFTTSAMEKRIQRMGLANPEQSAAVKRGIEKSEKRSGNKGNSHKFYTTSGMSEKNQQHYLRRFTGECAFPGCHSRGYGRRQLCEPHRWEVIDREMLERSRRELSGEFKIDPWERNYDMVSDSPDVG